MDSPTGTVDSVDEQPSRDRMRAADSDREQVAEQLRAAHAEGRLNLTEYDQRVQHAWAARTYGELEALTADLPRARRSGTSGAPGTPAVPDHSRVPERHDRHRRLQRGAVTAWAGASAINLVIWAIVSLTTWHWAYPWWIWVVGPWGVLLLTGWLSGRAEDGRSAR